MPAKTAFFAEWHRFAPIFPTADASPTVRHETGKFKCQVNESDESELK
jgi:hypothetical protein